MLSTEMRARLTVVLVGARNPQNIGSAARAMQDFGFHDLRVVNEFAPPFEAAMLEATSAVGAGEVMRAARRYDNLHEAIADCGLVVGTTAIGGRGLTRPVMALKDAAESLLEELHTVGQVGEAPGGTSGGRVALLFGSEKTGLSNEALSFCSLLLTIPMFAPEGRHLSMNLGQSVAVCLYELTRGGFEGARVWAAPQPHRATVEVRERLLRLLLDAMQRSGYARRFPANARPNIVRQLVAQLGQTGEEAATWMGFLRTVTRQMNEDDSEISSDRAD